MHRIFEAPSAQMEIQYFTILFTMVQGLYWLRPNSLETHFNWRPSKILTLRPVCCFPLFIIEPLNASELQISYWIIMAKFLGISTSQMYHSKNRYTQCISYFFTHKSMEIFIYIFFVLPTFWIFFAFYEANLLFFAIPIHSYAFWNKAELPH